MKRYRAPNQPTALKYVDSEHKVRLVTGVDVELDEAAEAVVLSLMDDDRAKTPLVYAFPVPAAAQLSRRLDEIVQGYLYSENHE